MLSGRVIQSRIMLSSSAESDYPARGQCSAHLSIPPILSALTAAPHRAGQNSPVIAANTSRRQPQWAAAPLTHQNLVILMPALFCFLSPTSMEGGGAGDRVEGKTGHSFLCFFSSRHITAQSVSQNGFSMQTRLPLDKCEISRVKFSSLTVHKNDPFQRH